MHTRFGGGLPGTAANAAGEALDDALGAVAGELMGRGDGCAGTGVTAGRRPSGTVPSSAAEERLESKSLSREITDGTGAGGDANVGTGGGGLGAGMLVDAATESSAPASVAGVECGSGRSSGELGASTSPGDGGVPEASSCSSDSEDEVLESSGTAEPRGALGCERCELTTDEGVLAFDVGVGAAAFRHCRFLEADDADDDDGTGDDGLRLVGTALARRAGDLCVLALFAPDSELCEKKQ